MQALEHQCQALAINIIYNHTGEWTGIVATDTAKIQRV